MRYIFLVLFGASSYGVLATFVKLAYDEGFKVNEVVGAQIGFGIIMLWAIALMFTRVRASGRQWLALLAAGTTVGLTSIFYYAALQYVPASIAIVLLFQFVWIGMLIEAVIRRQWPSKSQLLAGGVLIIGTFLAGGATIDAVKSLSWLGIGLGLVSAATYALFIVVSGRVVTQLNPLLRSAIMITGAFILVCIVFPPTFVINGSLTDGLWRWGLLLGIFGIVIPPITFAIGIPRIGGTLASIISAIELPVAVLMALIVLREQVTAVQWIGIVAILAGIMLPKLPRLSKAKKIGE